MGGAVARGRMLLRAMCTGINVMVMTVGVKLQLLMLPCAASRDTAAQTSSVLHS